MKNPDWSKTSVGPVEQWSLPRRFGSYVLLQPLAHRGISTLYLALTGTTAEPRSCVTKIVPVPVAGEENQRRFRDEATVARRMSHPNLVHVFDSGQVDDAAYLAMDFVDGGDLRNTWNHCVRTKTRIPMAVAVHIVQEVARGLHYAHTFSDLKVVHRCVCPPNILLSFTGDVCLGDFSLASSTLKLEHTPRGTIWGNLGYLSPEQARGEPLDSRTDVYSAGVVLWELLTGQSPFAGMASDRDRLALQQNPSLNAPSKVASYVPPELDSIVMRALRPDRNERYQTCEALRFDLAAYLARTSPKFDAADLANFMSKAYGDEIETEHREREKVTNDALAMMKVSVGSGASDRDLRGHSVFISYRRSDDAHVVDRLVDSLAGKFGRESIFHDIDSIPFGVDYRKHLTDAVGSCSACIVVMGRYWLTTCDDEGRRRLDLPDDFVRIEIENALRAGVPVIPVFVNGAKVPKEDELPESIRALAFRQGTPLRPAPDFSGDVARLIRFLERLVTARA